MISRFKTDELVEILEFFPVLGIVGPRQVGKTTLSKVIAQKIQLPSVYVDLENPEDEIKLTDPLLFLERHKDELVVFDEIQRKPELFPILRSVIDKQRRPGRFLLLGSASPDLIRDSSESLAGRIAYEELTPFNLTEITDIKSVEEHWFSGGFPDALLAPNDKMRKKWHQNFVQTYVERDLPALGLSIDKNILKKLWTMLAHLNGNLLNMSLIGKSLELSSTTIKKYVNFLEDAFLIRQLAPYSLNIKKRLVKSPKIYVRDSGLFHHILGVDEFAQLENNPVIGASWEAYVVEQICQLAGQDFQPYFYRTQDGSECDLLLVKSGKIKYAIEIKYSSVPKLKKGLVNAFDDLKAERNFIITPASDDFMIQENIQVCSIETFLNNHLQNN